MSATSGRPRRPLKALVAIAAIAGGTFAVPLAAPAGAATKVITDCEDETNGLQAALSDATVDVIQLAEGLECTATYSASQRVVTIEGLGTGAIFTNVTSRHLRLTDAGASVVRNVTFRGGNYGGSGGGLKVQGDSAPTIDNVTFLENTASGQGGGLAIKTSGATGTTTVENSTFTGNDAQDGGGLFIDTTTDIVLTGNTFDANVARLYGGGAALRSTGDAEITIAGNAFTDNDVVVPACSEGSGYGGGGLSFEGRQVYQNGAKAEVAPAAADDGRPDVSQIGNTFRGNTVATGDENYCSTAENSAQVVYYYGDYYGGGELVRNATVHSRDDRFVRNSVSNIIQGFGFGEAEGGGLSVENASFEALEFRAENLVLAGNEALGIGVGGGAYFGREGGVVATLTHATVVANYADHDGGGLAGGDEQELDELTLANSIVWGNSADGEANQEMTAHDDIAGFGSVVANFSDVCADKSQALDAGSADNICADPKLVDPSRGDVHQTTPSPTLDAASAALTGSLGQDYEGDARIQDSDGPGGRAAGPDMGADEHPAPPVVKEPEPDPEVQANTIAPGSIGEDDGYCQVAEDGGVFTFGGCEFLGAAGGSGVRARSGHITAPQSLKKLNAPIVSIAMQPSDTGYWQAATDGGVFTFGTAPFLGSMGATPLNNPINGIASSPTGRGYWLVASDGGVFSFGDAPFLGSMGGTPLTRPIVGIAATPSGKGYWLVASDGGVFSFGDAMFHGSAGGTVLESPVVGMASRPAGLGYWLATADGAVLTFGDAPFLGHRVGQPLNAPITGIKGTSSGRGYWLIAGDGGIFSFGSAPFLGSMGNTKLNRPAVDMTG